MFKEADIVIFVAPYDDVCGSLNFLMVSDLPGDDDRRMALKNGSIGIIVEIDGEWARVAWVRNLVRPGLSWPGLAWMLPKWCKHDALEYDTPFSRMEAILQERKE